MKTATFVLFALAAGIPAAFANFFIYRSTYDSVNNYVMGFSVYQDEPVCDLVDSAFVWRLRDDVSGLTGFRCVGGENCGFPSEVTELEMHFGNDIHFTIYEEQNWDLIGVDGAVYGNCFPFPGDDFHCVEEGGDQNGGNIELNGARFFQFLTNIYDAATLNQAGRDGV